MPVLRLALKKTDFDIALQLKMGIITLLPGAKSGEDEMKWTKPKVREIALGAEINCYACAELSA